MRPLRLTPKSSVIRCADDVIPAGSVASTASSSGGTITRTRVGLLGHNSVGVLCAQRVKEATPLCSPTAIIQCINEWVLLLDTESHRATAHRND